MSSPVAARTKRGLNLQDNVLARCSQNKATTRDAHAARNSGGVRRNRSQKQQKYESSARSHRRNDRFASFGGKGLEKKRAKNWPKKTSRRESYASNASTPIVELEAAARACTATRRV
jgi:hypothetical protein